MFHIRLAHRMRGKLSADPGSHLIVDAHKCFAVPGMQGKHQEITDVPHHRMREIGRI